MANTTVYPFGTGGSLPSNIGVVNDLTTGGADKALSAQMGVELKGEISIYDRTDFVSSSLLVGDIGIVGYASPSEGHAITINTRYRHFWVRARSGDIIHTYTQGYSDVVSIGFNDEPSTSDMTVLLADSGLSERTATAPYDGYFFVSICLETAEHVEVNSRVWVVISEVSFDLDGYELDIKKLQLVASVGNTASLISTANISAKIYKAKSGDVFSVMVKQYQDTAAIFYTQSFPSSGDTATCLAVGSGSTTLAQVQATAPNDGYISISYFSSNEDGFSNPIVETSDTGFYVAAKMEYMKGECGFFDYRNCIHFTAAPTTEMSDAASWTGEQIISNIYEPLRQSHPEYVSRRSLGKDQTNTYDIWLYEFNNTVEELFNRDQKSSFSSDIILPGADTLTAKQCGIKKSTYDTFFAGKTYKDVYFRVESTTTMVKHWIEKTEETVNGETYYIFTFDTNVKIITSSEQSAIEVWWTTPVKTYDQHAAILSGVHADEPVGYIGLGLALKYLIENHANNPTLDYIYNHVKLSVIPIMNVWGANQTPKKRTFYSGNGTNAWTPPLPVEQAAVANYIQSVKEELSFFVDFHTSENWRNYGLVYAITIPHVKIYPAVVSAAGYLCKHWFPNLPPYNWNIGGMAPNADDGYIASKYIYQKFGIQSATVEFCGKDLAEIAGCAKWSAQYMTYAVENYLNYMIALCGVRVKSNSRNIIDNDVFNRSTMG